MQYLGDVFQSRHRTGLVRWKRMTRFRRYFRHHSRFCQRTRLQAYPALMFFENVKARKAEASNWAPMHWLLTHSSLLTSYLVRSLQPRDATCRSAPPLLLHSTKQPQKDVLENYIQRLKEAVLASAPQGEQGGRETEK